MDGGMLKRSSDVVLQFRASVGIKPHPSRKINVYLSFTCNIELDLLMDGIFNRNLIRIVQRILILRIQRAVVRYTS